MGTKHLYSHKIPPSERSLRYSRLGGTAAEKERKINDVYVIGATYIVAQKIRFINKQCELLQQKYV